MEKIKFYNYKIAALQRSVNYLKTLETLTEYQSTVLQQRKKDLVIFKGKRTKAINATKGLLLAL